MDNILKEKESFLNFSFLTASFYNFIFVSGENFKKIKLAQSDDKFEQKFDDLNKDNFFNYLDDMSFIQNVDEKTKQKKIKLIKTVFNLDFDENKKEKIFFELSKKMTISIFSNKNKLIKLLSSQIINFIFEIYELIYLIIKNMEKSQKVKIQQIKQENLMEINKIKQDKNIAEKNLLNENNVLKEKITSLNKLINNNKNEENISKDNKELENEIIKLNEKMSNFEQKIQEMEKSNNLLVKEIEDIKKKQNLAEENYQSMKNLNINILKERISSNEEIFDKYKETIKNLKKDNCELKLHLDNCNIEISKKDFEINCLNKLNDLYSKDYQNQINQLKEEIEFLKKSQNYI